MIHFTIIVFILIISLVRLINLKFNITNLVIQELELVEDEINEQPEQPENSVSDFIKSNEEISNTNLLDRKLSPFLKKIYRLKRVKNLNDFISQFRRDQDEIDYGTILYVGKRNN